MKSLNKLAVISGISYLIIFFTGFFSNFYVVEGLIIKSDPTQTFNNLINNQFLFRLGILSFVIMVLLDLLLVWTLYYLLESTNKSISLLASLFRLVNAAVFGIALHYLINIANIANSFTTSDFANREQVVSSIMVYTESFNAVWLVGLIFFGIHLLMLGYLVYKSESFNKIIGSLLIVAGIGYLIDSSAYILLRNYNEYKELLSLIVIIPGVVGELSLTILLLVKGLRKRFE